MILRVLRLITVQSHRFWLFFDKMLQFVVLQHVLLSRYIIQSSLQIRMILCLFFEPTSKGLTGYAKCSGNASH